MNAEQLIIGSVLLIAMRSLSRFEKRWCGSMWLVLKIEGQDVTDPGCHIPSELFYVFDIFILILDFPTICSPG